MLRFSHPARDLGFFFFMSTDAEFRKKYLHDCLRVYYETFHGYLKLHGVELAFSEFLSGFEGRRHEFVYQTIMVRGIVW